MRRLNFRGFLLSGALLAGSVAHAQIQGYGQSWYITYEQTGSSQPLFPIAAGVQTTVVPSTPNDFLAGTWTGPTGTLPDYIYTPTLAITYSANYGSDEAGFLAAYPAGHYLAKCTSGNFAAQDGVIPATVLDFANEIPWFNGGTYAAMQLCPAGVARPVTWPAFTTSNVMPIKGANLTVVNYTVPGDNYFAYLSDTSTGTTIPGASLKSGRHYYLDLDYTTSDQISGFGFGGTAPVGWSFHRRSGFFFDVKSSPGTVAGQIVLDNFYRPIGEVVDYEILSSSGTVIESGQVTLGYQDYFVLETSVIGNYRIRFKGRHWLSRVTSPQRFDLGVNGLVVHLTNGDVNGDNIVDIADYVRLAASFSAVPGDANFDEAADLDGSSLVDIADYSYLAAAFSQVGE